jgi:hypothetical protein
MGREARSLFVVRLNTNPEDSDMTTYRNDPRWIPARYAGKCTKCSESFGAGRMVFYYPIGKRLLSGQCAIAAANDFDAMKRDEEFYCGQ